jgi:hypothetical protein
MIEQPEFLRSQADVILTRFLTPAYLEQPMHMVIARLDEKNVFEVRFV